MDGYHIKKMQDRSEWVTRRRQSSKKRYKTLSMSQNTKSRMQKRTFDIKMNDSETTMSWFFRVLFFPRRWSVDTLGSFIMRDGDNASFMSVKKKLLRHSLLSAIFEILHLQLTINGINNFMIKKVNCLYIPLHDCKKPPLQKRHGIIALLDDDHERSMYSFYDDEKRKRGLAIYGQLGIFPLKNLSCHRANGWQHLYYISVWPCQKIKMPLMSVLFSRSFGKVL